MPLSRSALAKAGKSVLLVDQEDTYGSEYASFTLEALVQAARGVVQPSLTAEGPDAPTGHQVETTECPDAPCDVSMGVMALSKDGRVTQPGAGDDASGTAAGMADAAGASREVRRVPLPAFRLPLHGVERHIDPAGEELDQSKKASRSYILDLLPKASGQLV